MFGGSFGPVGGQQSAARRNGRWNQATLGASASLTSFNLYLEDDGGGGDHSASKFLALCRRPSVIAAGPTDRVDTIGKAFLINGHPVLPMPPESDGAGQPLPVWQENRVLGPYEFFVFSDRIPNSFDSRCYGPINRKDIATVRRPILVWSTGH